MSAVAEERSAGFDPEHGGNPLDLHVLAIPPELYAKLQAAAEAGGLTVPEALSSAAREWLERRGAGGPRPLNEKGR